MSEVLAAVCADIHLSHRAPTARSVESDWYVAQERYLNQLTGIANEYKVPIICAGDVFDRYNPPPELINWAKEHLPPECYAIPGQHDIPYHDLGNLQKSAFWTLKLTDPESQCFVWLKDSHSYIDPRLRMFPFPFGAEVKTEGLSESKLNVAVIHGCVALEDQGYPGLERKNYVRGWKKRLEGFDVAIFGDNHVAFEVSGKPFIYNCGCLIPRKISERNHKPSVGLLKDDGTVERIYLDCSKDKWVEVSEEKTIRVDMGELIKEMNELAEDSLDFREALERYAENAETGVKSVIRELLEEV